MNCTETWKNNFNTSTLCALFFLLMCPYVPLCGSPPIFLCALMCLCGSSLFLCALMCPYVVQLPSSYVPLCALCGSYSLLLMCPYVPYVVQLFS